MVSNVIQGVRQNFNREQHFMFPKRIGTEAWELHCKTKKFSKFPLAHVLSRAYANPVNAFLDQQ
jgi:hypothetical protein